MQDRIEIYRRLERQYLRDKMGGLGLQPLDGMVARLLGREGQMRQEDIARQIVVDKGAVARSLARLEGLGLVERTVSRQCRREKLVALTPQGLDTAGQIQRVLAEWDEISYRGFTPQERALYDGFLTRITQNVTHFKAGGEANG